MSISSTQTFSYDAVSPCCKNEGQTPPWLKCVDTICRIAIGAFAAFIAPHHFLVSFGLGAFGGIAYASIRYLQQKPMFPTGESKPVCAQGYMDFLSGMRFPPVIGTIATATFIAAHMRHDPQFYVPFCGFFLGFWIGRETVTLCKDLGGRSFSHNCCHAQNK